MRDKTTNSFVKNLAKTAYPGWKGRKFYVQISDKARRLLSYWDGGSKDDFRVVEIATGQISHPPTVYPFGGENNPNYQPQPGFALVEHSIFCGKDGGCTVYLHPDDQEKLEE